MDQVQAGDQWEVLRAAIFPHVAEAAELKSAGVTSAAIDALYAPSFEAFSRTIIESLSASGASRLLDLKESDLSKISSEGGRLIEALALRRYGHYEFIDAHNAALGAELNEFVHQLLLGDAADEGDAAYYANWCTSLAFISYWLVLHPEHAFADEVRFWASEKVASWVSTNLLEG